MNSLKQEIETFNKKVSSGEDCDLTRDISNITIELGYTDNKELRLITDNTREQIISSIYSLKPIKTYLKEQ